VADHLATLVDVPVQFAEDCIGEKAEKAIKGAKEGEIVLLENVCFHPEEKQNEPKFAMKLATHADLFVNDAFGSSHRAHASVAGVTEFLQPSVSGFLLEKEIQYLEDSVNSPSRPFVAILGGAKVSDKIGVIENLITKVDTIIIGGGMTYTFFKAKGFPVGDSLVEDDKVKLAGELMEKAEEAGIHFMLPIDSVVAKEFKNDAEHKVVDQDGIEPGWMALDIGPQSAIAFSNRIRNARTVLWNGPMGVFELAPFAGGTHSLMDAVVSVTKQGATTIIGGGDTATAAMRFGCEDAVSHVSTGGGASLELLEGKHLPGVAALEDA
jgi:phosphoglycerate kinase